LEGGHPGITVRFVCFFFLAWYIVLNVMFTELRCCGSRKPVVVAMEDDPDEESDGGDMDDDEDQE
jgi:hypothetical protein